MSRVSFMILGLVAGVGLERLWLATAPQQQGLLLPDVAAPLATGAEQPSSSLEGGPGSSDGEALPSPSLSSAAADALREEQAYPSRYGPRLPSGPPHHPQCQAQPPPCLCRLA